MIGARFPLANAVYFGMLRRSFGRVALSVCGIALGVALGVAIATVNRAALTEFIHAARALSGDADVEIRGGSGGFPEALYPLLATMPQVAVASPIVDVNAKLLKGGVLRIVGIDLFRAARMQPMLSRSDDMALRADTIYLTTAAARTLDLQTGDEIALQIGLATTVVRFGGIAQAPGALGIMDIGAAQWRLQRVGSLSRIDIRLRDSETVEDFMDAVQQLLPPGVHVAQPEQIEERSASASRAYRVNLNMLALIALFTGGFLVFSTQALAVFRRRTQFAVLRALGLLRRQLIGLLLAEAMLIGALGAISGVVLGMFAAGAILDYFGGDLGAGYFRGMMPLAAVEPRMALAFAMLGIGVAALGSLISALAIASIPLASALRSDTGMVPAKLTRAWPGFSLIAAGAALSFAPAIDGTPVFGYLAIGLILIGAIASMPRFSTRFYSALIAPRHASTQLPLKRLRVASTETAIGLAAIVVSFSLVVAMAIMVASFRNSLAGWLDQVLPADLYLRAARASDTAYLDREQQSRIRAVPGVARVEFLRVLNIALDPARPPVALIARTIPPGNPSVVLPMQGDTRLPAAGAPPPAFISEAVRDVYNYAVGAIIEVPIAGKIARFTVAGIWRDYARQHGAIAIERERYIELSDDDKAGEAALWLAPGYSASAIASALAAQSPAGIEVDEPAAIRARSLGLFDSTFAITYALEAVAIVIGLAGVANSFSASALARRTEFGMLRHIGMRRKQILTMLGVEGALLAGSGAVAGLGLGFCISLILIHVVNRQSFHWSMELHMPWLTLAPLTAALLIAAAASALFAGRHALRGDAVRAVREDW